LAAQAVTSGIKQGLKISIKIILGMGVQVIDRKVRGKETTRKT
jgi:hypothetical protein